MYHAGITGTGYALPEKNVTNYDLMKMVETSNDWIVERTGIENRRIIDIDMPLYELGAAAGKTAIKNAGLKKEDIDLVIVATETPDSFVPSMSCRIQGMLSLRNAAAFDMNAACSGFIYALNTARCFISTGIYKNILVIACEALSRITDWNDRNTCVLFGDGAGAVVVGRVEKGGILFTDMGADGNGAELITAPCLFHSIEDIRKRNGKIKNYLRMEGKEVFKFAVGKLTESIERCVREAGIGIQDVDMIIPHQANSRIIEASAKKLGIPNERMVKIIENYGNMSSASIPIALAMEKEKNLIRAGERLIMCSFGGGLTWASAYVEWQ
ncbi:MAG: beta-ketoacyl-ACP synthase III [Clostridia bacterium]